MKKISIIIPVYNKEDRIRDCLDSILNQKISDVEVICVDDMSTDNSYRIVLEYSNKYSEIVAVKNNENRGAGYSRNVALALASGEYVWFIDADDYICDNSLRQIMDIIIQQDVDVLAFDLLRIDEKGKYYAYSLNQSILTSINGESLFEQIGKEKKIRASTCTQVYSKRYLDRINLKFTEGLIAEDAVFSMRAMICAKKVQYLREPLYIYHKCEQSVSTSTSDYDYFIGTFIAYCAMQQFWEEGEWNYALSQCMVEFIVRYYKIAVKHYTIKDKEKIDKFISIQEKYIQQQYQLLVAREFTSIFVQSLSREKIDVISQAKEVMIYGAGNVARDIVNLLDNLDIQIVCYVVSDYSNTDPKSIYGVPVKRVDEVPKSRRNSLVLIATMPNKYANIIDSLTKNRYTNYMCVIDPT